MAANPIIVPITPPRVAFLDARGFISREWYRFLLSLATQVESGAIDVDILLLAPEAVTPDQIAVLEAQIQALALQPLPPLVVPDPNNMKYVPVSGGDDTATIQALINAGLNTLYFHAATYSYTTLTITTPVRFCGVVSSIDGAPATVLNRTGANASTGITFGAIASAQLSGILVENIVFTATVAAGGVLMQFNHCADVIVRGCQFHTLNLTAKAIGFEQVNTFTVTDTRIINPTASGIYGESDDTHRSDVINLTRVIISGDSTGAHIYIPNAVELNGFVNTLCITDCEFVTPGRGVYRHNTIGATPRAEFISATNLQIDYPYYEGVLLAAGNSAFFADSYIHGSVTAQNVYVGHNAVNTIDNISFIGGQCTGAYLAGMYLNGNYQKIIGMEISGNGAQSSGTYPGIEIGANSQSTLITGNHIGERTGYQAATQSYGVKIDSGALQVVITNNDLRDNVTGTILNGGDGANSEYILGPNLGITTPDSFATKVVTTGFNVAFGPSALQYDVSHMSFFPAGTLATGTLTLFTKPADFQSLTVFSTQTITALTLTPGAGQFISATCPTTLSARGFISLFYNPSDATWYPCAESSGSPSGVISFNTRTGAVTLTSADVTGALGFTPANINNPRFTGNLEVNDVNYYLNVTSSNPYLNFDTSDYLTYDRTANTLTTVIGGSNVLSVSAAAVQVPVKMEVTDANYYLTVTSSTPYLNFDTSDYLSYTRSTNTMNFVIGGSTIASIAATGADLLGSPTATTASPGDNTTRISTTAFVTAAVAAAATGVSSITGTANEITASASTGAVTLSLPAALTFTGKTVTGGTFASPTISGTVAGAHSYSGALTLSAALTYGGVTLSNSVTGTGSMALSANPRFTGNLEVTDADYYLTVTASTPYLNFDTSDYLSYTRSTNTMNFAIGGSNVFTLTAAAATFTGDLMLGGTTAYGKLTVNSANAAILAYQTSSTGYSGFRIYNDILSNVRALEIDYSGSAYAGPLILAGPSGEQAAIVTTGAYPLVFGTGNTFRGMFGTDGSFLVGSTTSAGAGKARIENGLGIGMTPSNILDITQNQNASSKVALTNATSASAARSIYELNSGTGNMSLYCFSQGYTNSGFAIAGGTWLRASGGQLSISIDTVSPIVFGINGTEVARFDTSGNLAFASGTKGIIFNNSSALTNSTLNDYEVGTWTPTFNATTIAGSYSLAGYYIKVGAMVFISVEVAGATTFTSTANSSSITGLPFTIAGSYTGLVATNNYIDDFGVGAIYNGTTSYIPSINQTGVTKTYVFSGTYRANF